MDFKARLKNVYFILGIVGVVLVGCGVNYQEWTSWGALFASVMTVLSNPVAIIGGVLAFLGIFVDTSTKGFLDRKDEEK